MPFSPLFMDHYKNPRNVGSFPEETPGVGSGLVGSPVCGDVMQIQIKVGKQEGKEVVEEARFKTFGCGSAIASSSLATEKLKGRTLKEALEIKNTEIAGALELPEEKVHCSVLAEDAIKSAIEDYRRKKGGKKGRAERI